MQRCELFIIHHGLYLCYQIADRKSQCCYLREQYRDQQRNVVDVILLILCVSIIWDANNNCTSKDCDQSNHRPNFYSLFVQDKKHQG